MKNRKFVAALAALLLCLSLCLPAALAVEQRAEVSGLKVKVKCTGTADIPEEQLTVRLTPRTKDAPMPDGKDFLEVTVNTADCTKDNGWTASAVFPGTFVYTTPGQYDYEVTQQSGTAANGTYDSRTLIVRVTASWEKETFGCVVKVFEDGASSNTKEDDILFTNRYNRPDDPYEPTPIPDPEPTPTPTPTPDPTPDPTPNPNPDATTPTAPAVADARPDAQKPTVPGAETPTAPAVADARPTLIQTGQLNWPVPVMIGAGALLMAAGVVLLSGKRKDDHA